VLGVREDSPAAAAYDAAVEHWARADDAWQGVTWTLAHDPEAPDSKPLREDGKLRTITSEGARSIGLPTLTVVYEYDAHYITIRDARFTDAKATFAGRA
jgi:hypothetical protein